MSAATLRAFVSLSRPQAALFVALLPSVTYWFAFWDHGRLVAPRTWIEVHLFLLALTTIGHAATMWLNAALDRDQEDVLWGRATEVPRRIELVAYGAFLLSLILAFAYDLTVGVISAVSTSLAIIYSHPRTMWKGRAWLGPLSNLVGYGVMMPLMGLILAGLPLTARSWMILALMGPAVVGVYLAAQAHQQGEDGERGYRTFVVLYGPVRTLQTARALVGASVIGLLALSAAGYFPRVVLTVAIPFAWVDLYLRRWMKQPDGGDSSWAYGFVLRLLAAVIWGALVVCGDYLYQEWMELPRGGLGTALGAPR